MQASALRVTLARERARVCTHARTHVSCAYDAYVRMKLPKEGSREVPPMPSSSSCETTPRRHDFAYKYEFVEKFAEHFPKEQKDSLVEIRNDKKI